MQAEEPIAIAIIGIGCRFPNSNCPEAFWKLLAEGRNAWTQVPEDRFSWDSFSSHGTEPRGSTNHRGGHFIQQDITAFDSDFFGINPLEAKGIDPQQRLLLETSYEAMESAGIPAEAIKGTDTAVFAAIFANDYEHMLRKDLEESTRYHFSGTGNATFANRISHTFDLRGPSITIDTGCSGSLVALHQACHSLRSLESSLAIAGGAVLMLSPDQTIVMSQQHLLNNEGRCFSFDSRGSGYGRGEGAAMLLLQRLDDAIRDGSHIRAIIRSSAVNQDGWTPGITFPSQVAQECLTRTLFNGLKFGPNDIHYVEAHGTGTVAGDQTELRAIQNIYCEVRRAGNPLLVGCAKPNIGHLESVSGVAGLIKVVLCMEKGQIPPNILFHTPKEGITWYPALIKYPTTAEAWPSFEGPRRAVINNFGYGGTNAALLLESFHCGVLQPMNAGPSPIEPSGLSHGQPELNSTNTMPRSRWHLVQLSAKSECSLRCFLKDMQAWLKQDESVDLGAIACTLAHRSTFPWRHAVVTDNVSNLIRSLQNLDALETPRVCKTVFVFTGQGAQWPKMGVDLMVHPVYYQSIQASDRILREEGASWSLLLELKRCENGSIIHNSSIAQPATTALQIALVQLLRSWNIVAGAVIGHSSGEIAAAFTAGILSHENALKVAYHRGFLSTIAERNTSATGGMLAVALSEQNALKHIEDLCVQECVTVACVNSPASITLSGDLVALSNVKATLDARGVSTRFLKTDTAYHSIHMKVVASEYRSAIYHELSQRPEIDFYSTVEGKKLDTGIGSEYWVANLVSPVKFSKTLEALYSDLTPTEHGIFLEVGPHSALRVPIRETLQALPIVASWAYVPTLLRSEDGSRSVLKAAAALYEAGVNVKHYPKREPLTFLTNLPSYHWDHSKKLWHEPRLSRDYRLRRYPPHDLLGLRTLTSPDHEPSWRALLGCDRLPWLKDHVVDGTTVFPATACLSMVAEATDQWKGHMSLSNTFPALELRRILLIRSLRIPGSSETVETILSLRKNHTAWVDFRISSTSNDQWHVHCEGQVKVSSDASASGEQNGPVESLKERHHHWRKILGGFQYGQAQHFDTSAIYDVLRLAGHNYGSSFALLRDAYVTDQKAIAKVKLPTADPGASGTGETCSAFYSTLFDAFLQVSVFMFAKSAKVSAIKPNFVRRIRTKSWQPAIDVPKEITVICELDVLSNQTAKFSIFAFTDDDDAGIHPIFECYGGELRATDTLRNKDSDDFTKTVFQMKWEMDPASIRGEHLECLPREPSFRIPAQERKFRHLLNAAEHFISRAKQQLEESTDCRLDQQHVRVFQRLVRYVACSSDESQHELSGLGVEGELLARVGPSLQAILVGKVDPLSHLLENQLLYRVYQDDSTTRCNAYLIKYLHHLVFKNPSMRILELGAGTGGTTIPLFQSLSPNGEPFASCYHFTDVTSGFFEQARSNLAKWERLISMKTLNIETDPISQGYTEHSYDLIIASNALHTTKSISRSLHHAYKLLKSCGHLGLIELVRSNAMYDMTFALLPGWWAGVEDGRSNSPLLTPEQWDTALHAASFSGVDILARDFPGTSLRAAFIVSQVMSPSTPTGTNIITMQVVNLLGAEHRNHKFVTSLHDQLEDFGYQASIMPLERISTNRNVFSIIVDSHDAPVLTICSDAQFSHLRRLLLCKVMIVWITLPTKPSSQLDPGGALFAGLVSSARSENETLQCITVDVRDNISTLCSSTTTLLAALIARCASQKHVSDTEYRIEDGNLFIPRIVTSGVLSGVSSNRSDGAALFPVRFHQAKQALQMHVKTPGLLSSVCFAFSESSTDLNENEIEIEVQACGVNFKDVWLALGQMEAGDHQVGECAGVVVGVGAKVLPTFKVNDRVCALTATPYASRARASSHVVHKIPDNMSFAEAATVPVAFCTAYYSLLNISQLQEGQRVLIHSGSGALGQAAIQIAQFSGAEVFTTVSTSEKRLLLLNKYDIPDDHVFSSLPTAFKDDALRMTGGEGVDVALNSLAGDMLNATWECIAPMGVLVDVGKVDRRRNVQLDMEPFNKSITFASVDIMLLSKHRPKLVQDIVAAVFRMLDEGALRLVSPVTTIPIAECEQAFRMMQARKHTGKIVLEADDNAQVLALKQTLQLDSKGTYVIAGGLGAFGQRVCGHLCALGAGRVILLARRSLPSVERQLLEQKLTTGQSKVTILQCDIADRQEVSAIAQLIANHFGPLKGIMQSTMVLADRALKDMTHDDLKTTIDSKYYGTQNLMKVFRDTHLDFFIFLSSLSGVLGIPGQANYAAGSRYQDQVAQSQASPRWKKCISLDISVINGTHSLPGETRMQLNRRGVSCIPQEAVYFWLDYAMNPNTPAEGIAQILIGLDLRTASKHNRDLYSRNATFSHVFVSEKYCESLATEVPAKRTVLEKLAAGLQLPQENRRSFLETALREKIASLTAMSVEDVSVGRPIVNFGLDSLIAIELKSWVSKIFDAPMQTSDVLDSPSISALAALLLKKIRLSESPAINPTAENKSFSVPDCKSDIPKLPLQSLDDILNSFYSSMVALGSDEELLTTKQATEDFQRPGGVGSELYGRLEELAMTNDCWLSEIYNKIFWLQRRGPLRPWTNFFFSHPTTERAYTQTEKAALLTLTAFQYKQKLERDEVSQDFNNEVPQCMESLHHIFNASRRPQTSCDEAVSFPENDYIVAMRNGHVYQIPLTNGGETIARWQLSAIFESIRQRAPREVFWASMLTTDERNAWAATRKLAKELSASNKMLFDVVEKSLFIVCLDDGIPKTSEERARHFMLDDNFNRWNDKTLSFVVCENGASAFWCEHSMIDGTTLDQLGRAISQAVANDIERIVTEIDEGDEVEGFTYLPFRSSPLIDERIGIARKRYQESIRNVDFATLHLQVGENYLRQHKLPSKGALQCIISLAIRYHFSYNPASYEAVSLRSFRGGRTDIYQFYTPEMAGFVSAAESPKSLTSSKLKALLHDAAAAHAAGVTRTTRGRGWNRQLCALRAVLKHDESEPSLFSDPLYLKTRPRKVFVTFHNTGMQEWGSIWRDPEAIWMGVEVYEDKCKLHVSNGMGKAKRFCELVEKAVDVVRGIIDD